MARVAPIVSGIVAVVAIAAWAAGDKPALVVPNPVITRGEVATSDKAEICRWVDGLSYSQNHRLSQNPETKRQVLARYGVAWSERADFEDDHDVPLCLGGSDSIANRWPQPRVGVWNSAKKDDLEAVACRQVCDGEVRLETAQGWFLAPADWRVAYCEHFSDPACAEIK
jgi:hypothetical protein